MAIKGRGAHRFVYRSQSQSLYPSEYKGRSNVWPVATWLWYGKYSDLRSRPTCRQRVLRAKRDIQSAELSYVVAQREGRTANALTKLTLRQQLSKSNDARIILTHAYNTALSEAVDPVVIKAWHHD